MERWSEEAVLRNPGVAWLESRLRNPGGQVCGSRETKAWLQRPHTTCSAIRTLSLHIIDNPWQEYELQIIFID